MCPSAKQIASNSEEKPPAERPHMTVASPSGGQLSTSSADDVTQSSTSILDSVVKVSHSDWSRPTTRANNLGRTVAAAVMSVFGELRPARTARGCTDWYDWCTESLGYESLAEKMDVCNLPVEVAESSPGRASMFTRASRTTRTSGLMRDKTDSKAFPPILSTLDMSGRSRFSYERARTDDGRLRVVMVERNAPAIVRIIGEEGGVVMKMVTTIRDDEEEEDDEENPIEKNRNEEQ